MTRFTTAVPVTLFATLFVALPAAAKDICAIAEDRFEMDEAAVIALYDCMSERMLESYTQGGDEVAGQYREWQAASSRPAVAGPHKNHFLLTFVNPVGAAQYLKFEEGITMPVGSVLAKESIGGADGAAQVGPLFVMTKVADAPDYGNWVYSGVQPDGQPLELTQAFCHDCHVGFSRQDSMAYPLEEVRLTGGLAED